MICNRTLFIVITFGLLMITSISMAPFEDDEESVISEQTNDLPDVVTDGLLFMDGTGTLFDESIKTDGRLLYDQKNSLPKTPKPDEPRAIVLTTPNQMVNVSNDEM